MKTKLLAIPLRAKMQLKFITVVLNLKLWNHIDMSATIDHGMLVIASWDII